MFGKAPSSSVNKRLFGSSLIYVPHFQWISEMECLSPRTARLLLLSDPAAVPYLPQSMARDKADGERGDLRHKIDLAFRYVRNQFKKRNSNSLLVMADWTGT